ncbi:Pentatricopeptide repeat-containing protein [Apostasia shenzhenica]|uniref:Pentatricopeptide repeat-containing protein n=1 Tax=Apostasia shenzhenica TaxID=1088818 RepID=A0A2I0B336_9ASPA|nr:Pentatricopeptide repeat-containing protein [Apostasia shenzhenica]
MCIFGRLINHWERQFNDRRKRSSVMCCSERIEKNHGCSSSLAMASSSLPRFLHQNSLLSFLQKPRSLPQLLQIHAQSIIKSLSHDPFFASRLLLALSELPSPPQAIASYAELIFFQWQKPTSFLWNTMIKIHTLCSNPNKAIRFFILMRRNENEVDEYTYPFALRACSLIPGVEQGSAIHGEVLKRGNSTDLYVRNCLISFYIRAQGITMARRVFDEFGSKDLVTWNSMISGYACSGQMMEAQQLFDEMPERDRFSCAILIDGYGKGIGDLVRARKLFDEMPERDIVCWNSMIDGYACAGKMGIARALFDEMPMRNVISWSIMIDGHLRHGDPKEALNLFQQMLRQGTKPDRVSAVGAISACGQLGALDQGRWLHSYVKRKKMVLDVVVQTALIDMYMKCGNLEEGRRLFEEMNGKSVVSWNVMIVGLGTNGCEAEALDLFYRVEREGAKLDDLTFLGALTACTHGGLISEGIQIFDRMRSDFNIQPKPEHYGCLVDLLGRAGRLEEALEIVETVPMKPNSTLWGSILAACRYHRRVDLAEIAVERLASAGEDDGGVYVLLSNIYAEKGMWEEVWRVRRLMKERGMRKEIGRSGVEVDGRVHEFVNGEVSEKFGEDIHEVVWSLVLVMGSEI